MVKFVINENNIININKNIKDGKYKEIITSSSDLEIDKMLINPHLSEKFVENKNDNKPSLLMRFVEKYNREMFIENDSMWGFDPYGVVYQNRRHFLQTYNPFGIYNEIKNASMGSNVYKKYAVMFDPNGGPMFIKKM